MPRSRKLRPKDLRRLAVLAVVLLVVGGALGFATRNALLAPAAALVLGLAALLWLPAFTYLRAKYVPLWMRSRQWKMRMHMSAYLRD